MEDSGLQVFSIEVEICKFLHLTHNYLWGMAEIEAFQLCGQLCCSQKLFNVFILGMRFQHTLICIVHSTLCLSARFAANNHLNKHYLNKQI